MIVIETHIEHMERLIESSKSLHIDVIEMSEVIEIIETIEANIEIPWSEHFTSWIIVFTQKSWLFDRKTLYVTLLGIKPGFSAYQPNSVSNWTILRITSGMPFRPTAVVIPIFISGHPIITKWFDHSTFNIPTVILKDIQQLLESQTYYNHPILW